MRIYVQLPVAGGWGCVHQLPHHSNSLSYVQIEQQKSRMADLLQGIEIQKDMVLL